VFEKPISSSTAHINTGMPPCQGLVGESVKEMIAEFHISVPGELKIYPKIVMGPAAQIGETGPVIDRRPTGLKM
jgi:hypothetical protein